MSDPSPADGIPEGFVTTDARFDKLERVDGHKLMEDLIVLIVDSVHRPFNGVRAERAHRDARWCRITKTYEGNRPEIVYFDCVYADGSTWTKRSFYKYEEWFVWPDIQE